MGSVFEIQARKLFSLKIVIVSVMYKINTLFPLIPVRSGRGSLFGNRSAFFSSVYLFLVFLYFPLISEFHSFKRS